MGAGAPCAGRSSKAAPGAGAASSIGGEAGSWGADTPSHAVMTLFAWSRATPSTRAHANRPLRRPAACAKPGRRIYRPFFPRRTRSSAGEHYVDIVGVTGSIPVASTIASGKSSRRAQFEYWCGNRSTPDSRRLRRAGRSEEDQDRRRVSSRYQHARATWPGTTRHSAAPGAVGAASPCPSRGKTMRPHPPRFA